MRAVSSLLSQADAASNTATDDVTIYVTHRIFNTIL